jgi:hypothetical protein
MMDLMMPTLTLKKALRLLRIAAHGLTVQHPTTPADQQSENWGLKVMSTYWPIQSYMGCVEAYVWSYLDTQLR